MVNNVSFETVCRRVGESFYRLTHCPILRRYVRRCDVTSSILPAHGASHCPAREATLAVVLAVVRSIGSFETPSATLQPAHLRRLARRFSVACATIDMAI